MRRCLSLLLIAIIAANLLSGNVFASENDAPGESVRKYSSYLDIPGITPEEIKAIESIKENNDYLIYGMNPSSQAFALRNGQPTGFSKAFASYLSEIFGIEFRLKLYEWRELYSGLQAGSIDLSGELTATAGRRQMFHMTKSPVARVPIYRFALNNSHVIGENPVYCFLENTSTEAYVREAVNYSFEAINVPDTDTAIKYIKENKCDAYLDVASADYLFEAYPEIIGSEFYPFIYTTEVLSTAKDELKVIIDLSEKLLSDDGLYISGLYAASQDEYDKAMFSNSLTSLERAYISAMTNSNKSVLVACQTDNYPIVFYNDVEGAYQGAALDILDEISKLTGLKFSPDDNRSITDIAIMAGLGSGKFDMAAELTKGPERDGRFLWSEPYASEQFVLITLSDAPDLSISQIPFRNVGIIGHKNFEAVFSSWFSDLLNITVYYSLDTAFEALQNGAADAIFGTENTLLYATNLHEQSDLKANIIFDYKLDNEFGFNYEQTTLKSIVNKALKYVNTETIDKRWNNKTYDYKVTNAQETMSHYKVVMLTALAFAVCTAIVVFIYQRKMAHKNRRVQVIDDTLRETIRLCRSMVYEYDCVKDDFNIIAFDSETLGADINVLKGKLAPVLKYLLHPEDMEALLKVIDDFIYSKKEDKFSIRIRLKNFRTEEWIWFRNYGMTVTRTKNGYVEKLVGGLVFIDIAMKEVELYSAKMESERRTMEQLFDNNPYPCFMFDDKFSVLNCNKAMVKLFGFSDRVDAMKNTLTVLPSYILDVQKDGRASVPISTRLYKALNEGHERSESVFNINGKRVILNIEYTRIPYGDRYALVCYASDITQLRDNIAKLKSQRATIETQKTILEQHEKLLVAINELGAILFSRPETRWELTLPKAFDKIKFATGADVVAIWRNIDVDGRLFLQRFKSTVVLENRENDVLNLPYDVYLPEWLGDGIEEKYLSADVDDLPYEKFKEKFKEVSPMKSLTMMPIILNGVFWGSFILAFAKKGHTFSEGERRILKQAGLNCATAIIASEQNTSLIEATKAKSSFLSSMSHEIRTPLNAILGMAAIGQKSKTVDRMCYSFEKINEAGQHLLGVINDILDISKIESGKLELNNEEFDLIKAYKTAASIISFRANENRLSFVYDIDKNIPKLVIGDDQRFVQILINLLSNATKFTPKGGEVSMRGEVMEVENGYLNLLTTVKDTGIGISEENIDKLFDSFVQADNSTSRKFGGTGLGLAISKRIATMMDGDILAESKEGEGSTFKFIARFKISEKELPESEAVGEVKKLQTEFFDISGINILAAEDVEINQIVLEALLEETGASIEFADNGLEVIDKFSKNPQIYDIILMDVHMPEVDGYEATRRIRALENIPRAKDIPIVAITANVFREDIEKCLEAGMNSHLGKPVDRTELIAKLGQYFKK